MDAINKLLPWIDKQAGPDHRAALDMMTHYNVPKSCQDKLLDYIMIVINEIKISRRKMESK